VSGQDRTEKATPKRRQEARQRGQVAKSADINGAVVLLAAIFALSAFGPRMVRTLEESMRGMLGLIATPQAVFEHRGLGEVLIGAARDAATAAAPLLAVCLLAGVVANVAQVRLKLTPKAIKPSFGKLNPLKGAKNLLNPRQVAFEAGKASAKVAAVAAVTALAVLPKLEDLAQTVGMAPADLAREITSTVLAIAQRAGIAYLVIGALDAVYQRWRMEKQMRMTKQEVRDEAKNQTTPPEVRSAIRRRQMEAARQRMMADVPEADVVVTNPTHYAVALKYDGSREAPEVVAKGKDLVAARIRELAAAAGVPVISDPPLARALHRSVEVGQMIPEELFQAVAQLLAFVYRAAGRRALA
jgi:flagellar biosynthetic protein FlhB